MSIDGPGGVFQAEYGRDPAPGPSGVDGLDMVCFWSLENRVRSPEKGG